MKYHTKYLRLMNQSNLSIGCPSVLLRSVLVWMNSKNRAIHHCRVVGASSHKTSDTNAVHTKEKWYIKNHIWSATAERKYMDGCNTLPRSRRNTSWYSASYVQIQIGYDRGLWANMHKTRGCWKNNILYNIQHISKPSNANGGLQCTLHISAVNDHYILRFPWKVCTCISRQYIHILSEHLRAYRAHNESAPTTQRVTILPVKV